MSESSLLQQRLRSVQKSIRKATREALKAAESEETLSGIIVGGGEGFLVSSKNDRYTEGGTFESDGENDDPNCAGTGTRGEVDEAKEREAFELGMSLFGDDTAAIERECAERLSQVEGELRDIVHAGRETRRLGTQQRPSSATAIADEELDEVDEADLEREARSLAAKVAFLRRCTAARAALEEAEALALTEATGGSSSTEGGTLVDAARILSEAVRALEEAEDGLAVASQNGGPNSADVDVAQRIVDSIRSHTRRKRVDLQVRAATALDACIILTADSISVSSTAGGKKSSDGLADAYETLALMSSSLDSQLNTVDRLDDAMLALSNDLFQLILKPLLIVYKESVKNGMTFPKIDFQESSNSGSGVTSVPPRAGFGGPTHKLVWKHHDLPSGTICTIGEAAATKTSKTTLPIKQVIASFGEALTSIQTILAFVHEHVLLERQDLCRLFGRVLFGEVLEESRDNEMPLSGPEKSLSSQSPKDDRFGRFMSELVNVAWDICLPSSAFSPDLLSDLHDLSEDVRKYVSAFEQDIVEKNFLSLPLRSGGTGCKRSPLGELAANFERRYAEKRRTSILAQGRDLLLKGDYHNTTEVGKDVYAGRASSRKSPLDFDENDDGMQVFELHKCAISRVAAELMDLVQRTMDFAVDPNYFQNESSANALAPLPPTLYRTSRELFDLFRAVIPSTHGNEISTVPRTAAVLHNDCVFFAHRLLTFGLEYRDRFPDTDPACGGNSAAALRKICTFVDLVPPFRELADRTMVNTIERQKRQLADIVGTRISILRDALRSDEGVVEWTDAETALTAGAYHLKHLSTAWVPILSRDVYGRAMGNLVDTVFSLYLGQVLVARDISEAASHFIGALFRDAGCKMADLFSSNASSPEEATRVSQNYCSLWDKFEAVGKFMDMSLLDISNALSAGVFRSVTGPELTRLIKATFEESKRRKELIKVLGPDARNL